MSEFHRRHCPHGHCEDEPCDACADAAFCADIEDAAEWAAREREITRLRARLERVEEGAESALRMLVRREPRPDLVLVMETLRAALAPESEGAETVPVEIRRNEDGTLDEIVAHGAGVHLEQMGKGVWSLIIEDRHLNVFTPRGAEVRVELVDDSSAPEQRKGE